MPEKDTLTSIRVNADLWKEAKIYAIQHNFTLQELVEEALREKMSSVYSLAKNGDKK